MRIQWDMKVTAQLLQLMFLRDGSLASLCRRHLKLNEVLALTPCHLNKTESANQPFSLAFTSVNVGWCSYQARKRNAGLGQRTEEEPRSTISASGQHIICSTLSRHLRQRPWVPWPRSQFTLCATSRVSFLRYKPGHVPPCSRTQAPVLNYLPSALPKPVPIPTNPTSA